MADYKYMIRATEYYRNLLRSEAKKTELTYEKPDLVKGLEMLNSKEEQNVNYTSSNNKTQEPKSSFFGSAMSYFNTVKETVVDSSNTLKNKIVEGSNIVKDKLDKYEVKEKILATGAVAYEGAKTLGETAMDKGKELYVRKFLVYFCLFLLIFQQKFI